MQFVLLILLSTFSAKKTHLVLRYILYQIMNLWYPAHCALVPHLYAQHRMECDVMVSTRHSKNCFCNDLPMILSEKNNAQSGGHP